MFTCPRHISRPQRDRLLMRADRLIAYGETGRRRRPVFATTPARERRYRGVATRLRRFVAGVGNRDSTLALIERATQRHIAGVTGYAEWIEELRWSGLSARSGHTRLGKADALKRQNNLNRLYPRIDAGVGSSR